VVKKHIVLTKPGIIAGNLLTTGAGFALASHNNLDYSLFLLMMAGLGCIIASACVCNNYIDRLADQKMERTKNRPLATGSVSGRSALLFAAVLGLTGSFILWRYTNPLALFIALFGFFMYVVVYTLSKYYTSSATAIGSIAGATPPLVGYCAVSGRIDTAALILYSILVLWQMPHFYAIAVYRIKEYTSASIPVLPITSGMLTTKIHMLFYCLVFIGVAALPTLFGYTGYIYLSVMLLLSLFWLFVIIQGFKSTNDLAWGRKTFFVSLWVITAFSIALALDQPRGL